MKKLENIPHYISSFDLEQARLGQAIQSYKLLINDHKYLNALKNPSFLRDIEIVIRDQSVNAEWALKELAEAHFRSSDIDDLLFQEIAIILIEILLKKKN